MRIGLRSGRQPGHLRIQLTKLLIHTKMTLATLSLTYFYLSTPISQLLHSFTFLLHSSLTCLLTSSLAFLFPTTEILPLNFFKIFYFLFDWFRLCYTNSFNYFSSKILFTSTSFARLLHNFTFIWDSFLNFVSSQNEFMEIRVLSSYYRVLFKYFYTVPTMWVYKFLYVCKERILPYPPVSVIFITELNFFVCSF